MKPLKTCLSLIQTVGVKTVVYFTVSIFVAMLFAATLVSGCGGKSDSAQLYREAQLKKGMTIKAIKKKIGEPDYHSEYWLIKDIEKSLPGETYQVYKPQKGFPDHRETLSYGAFGAHDQKKGHVTKYRLILSFKDGKLRRWEKTSPVGRD